MSTKITKLRCALFNVFYSPEFAALGTHSQPDFFVPETAQTEALTDLLTHDFGPSHIPSHISRAVPGAHTLRVSFKTSSKPSDQYLNHVKYTILTRLVVLNGNEEPLRPNVEDIRLEFWYHNNGDRMRKRHTWFWFVLLLKLGIWEMFQADGQPKTPSLRRPLDLVIEGGHGVWSPRVKGEVD